MANLCITELTSMGSADNGEPQIPRRPGNTVQNIAIGATSVQSAVFQPDTRFVRLNNDVSCCTAVGSNPTATTASERSSPETTEFFSVKGGFDRIAVIASAT